MTKRRAIHTKDKSKQRVFLILIAIAGITALSFATSLIVQKRDLLANGVETEAVITGTSFNSARRNTPSMSSISYSFNTHDGKRVEVKNHYIPANLDTTFTVDDTLQITYLPLNPDKNEPTQTLHSLWYFYIYFPLYIVGVVLLISVFYRLVARLRSHRYVVSLGKTWGGGALLLIGTLLVFSLLMAVSINIIYVIIQAVEQRLLSL